MQHTHEDSAEALWNENKALKQEKALIEELYRQLQRRVGKPEKS